MAKVNNLIVLIFQLCVILEPMQELMSRHKTYNLNPRGDHFITLIITIIIIVIYISQDMLPFAPMFLTRNNSLVVVQLTVPLKSKLPPSRETLIVSRATQFASRTTGIA